MAECIHGFDEGMCAICFPAPEPETRPRGPAATSGAAGARRSSVSTRERAGSPSASGATSALLRAAARVDVGAARIYHVTHVDNLAGILGQGALLADVGDPAAAPAIDLAAPAVREFRRATAVGDVMLAEYVPFFLSVDAHFWEALRSGEPDPRLARGAAGRPAADHVIAVGSVRSALGADVDAPGSVAATDADVATGRARTATGWAEVERLLRSMLVADDGRVEAGEFLVHHAVPLERIVLIAVANDPMRDRVRAALTSAGFPTRVAVHPPWFQPSGGAVAGA